VTLKGCDSSFSVPTLAQARAAYADGVRVWGGYLGSRLNLGLAVRWGREQFAVVQQAGMTAIGFCSGWDDPDWIRTTAAAWGILPCVDVEHGIRDDGPWVRDWVRRAGCGLYGLGSTHYEPGEPVGRDAAFNIVARYPSAGCTGASWDPAAGQRPPRLCAWQCQGSHTEYGVTVDTGFYDVGFAPDAPALAAAPITAGGRMFIPYDVSKDPFDEVYADVHGECRWGLWAGGAGQAGGWEGELTTLGSPEGAKDLVQCDGCHTTHDGALRLNVRGVRSNGDRYLLVVDLTAGKLIQGWRKMPSTPRQFVAAAVGPAGPAGPVGAAGPPGEAVTDDHIAEMAVAAMRAELLRLANG
jgi:hypothetical protein